MGYSSNVEQGRGGLGSFKCFKSSKTVTSLQRAAKINPQSHTHTRPQEKRKMGPVHTAHSLAFSPAREAKWKSMRRSTRVMLHVFVCISCLCVCVKYTGCLYFILHVLCLNLVNPERNRLCLWMFSRDVYNPLKDHL